MTNIKYSRAVLKYKDEDVYVEIDAKVWPANKDCDVSVVYTYDEWRTPRSKNGAFLKNSNSNEESLYRISICVNHIPRNSRIWFALKLVDFNGCGDGRSTWDNNDGMNFEVVPEKLPQICLPSKDHEPKAPLPPLTTSPTTSRAIPDVSVQSAQPAIPIIPYATPQPKSPQTSSRVCPQPPSPPRIQLAAQTQIAAQNKTQYPHQQKPELLPPKLQIMQTQPHFQPYPQPQIKSQPQLPQLPQIKPQLLQPQILPQKKVQNPLQMPQQQSQFQPQFPPQLHQQSQAQLRPQSQSSQPQSRPQPQSLQPQNPQSQRVSFLQKQAPKQPQYDLQISPRRMQSQPPSVSIKAYYLPSTPPHELWENKFFVPHEFNPDHSITSMIKGHHRMYDEYIYCTTTS